MSETFLGLTAAQQEVFGLVAMGQDGGHDRRTLRALQRKGLVASYIEKLPGGFPVVVARYYVPTPVHMRWCAWCAEQFERGGASPETEERR